MSLEQENKAPGDNHEPCLKTLKELIDEGPVSDADSKRSLDEQEAARNHFFEEFKGRLFHSAFATHPEYHNEYGEVRFVWCDAYAKHGVCFYGDTLKIYKEYSLGGSASKNNGRLIFFQARSEVSLKIYIRER